MASPIALVSAVMAKKTKKESTEWALGQPLVFPKKHNPTGVNPPPREVEAAIGKLLTEPKKRLHRRHK
jgi:hypothetical protein